MKNKIGCKVNNIRLFEDSMDGNPVQVEYENKDLRFIEDQTAGPQIFP
jgi:hypothetical protein